MNKYAANTLETRLLYHEFHTHEQKDLYNQYYRGKINREQFIETAYDTVDEKPRIVNQELSDSANNSIILDIKKQLKKKYNRTSVDVIIGGPPCQSYSLAGRGKNKEKMHNDPRNFLYKYYLHFLEVFQPEIFVFENVPGLISAKKGTIYNDVIRGCADAGYHLDQSPHILNSSDFEVMQERERIIFIGWKKEHKHLSYPEFSSKKPRGTVMDLLADLPHLQAGEGCDEFQRYKKGLSSQYLLNKKIKNGMGGIRHHLARKHNDRDREIYRIAIKKWNESRHRLNYNELPEELKTHKNRRSFLDRYKVVDSESYSHAVLAHLGKDGHYFIHPDINQARSLTVREAARIQSFPDDYLFEGPRLAKYVQIGNAVPPLMAEGIAGKIERMLKEI
ncbi:MAG: DNA (cytosine-5-)-methyltransferase [Methanoregula sp.]|nr:DNA (cytosine-5-)-methyltransferase [Methanoregula sp.]